MTAIVGWMTRGEKTEYRTVGKDFDTWCEHNYLQLNVIETKELAVDLRRIKASVTHVRETIRHR